MAFPWLMDIAVGEQQGRKEMQKVVEKEDKVLHALKKYIMKRKMSKNVIKEIKR